MDGLWGGGLWAEALEAALFQAVFRHNFVRRIALPKRFVRLEQPLFHPFHLPISPQPVLELPLGELHLVFAPILDRVDVGPLLLGNRAVGF